jgi:ABC-type dipeptide/oligopeptide/nickel transport system ATPase component
LVHKLNQAWTAHANGVAHQRRSGFLSLLESVRLPRDDALLRRYPGELSVGQAQSLLIAMAILHRPSMVVADEPTSALDVVTQAEILKLLAQLNRDLNIAVLYISHDLLSVSAACQRVAILQEGQIVECGRSEEIFRNPRHAYTRRLLDAVPKNPFR